MAQDSKRIPLLFTDNCELRDDVPVLEVWYVVVDAQIDRQVIFWERDGFQGRPHGHRIIGPFETRTQAEADAEARAAGFGTNKVVIGLARMLYQRGDYLAPQPLAEAKSRLSEAMTEAKKGWQSLRDKIRISKKERRGRAQTGRL